MGLLLSDAVSARIISCELHEYQRFGIPDMLQRSLICTQSLHQSLRRFGPNAMQRRVVGFGQAVRLC